MATPPNELELEVQPADRWWIAGCLTLGAAILSSAILMVFGEGFTWLRRPLFEAILLLRAS